MKRFILSTLAITVFFLGLGSLVERTGAKFKSDEKALALIAKARAALGGDAAIKNIQSMTIVGRTTKTFKVDGVERTDAGDTEIAVQFPDKFSRVVKLGDGTGNAMFTHDMNVIAGEPAGAFRVRTDAPGGEPGMHKRIVIKKDGTEIVLTDADADKWIAEHPDVPGEKRIVIKKDDGSISELPALPSGEKVIIRHPEGEEGNRTFTTKDGKTFNIVVDHAGHGDGMMMRHNDIVRFALGLLLTAPQGVDVEYTSAGEANVGGTPCNVINASVGDSVYKLFLDAASNLPVAMNYTGINMPRIMRLDPSTAPAPAPADGSKDVLVFRKAGAPETAEFQVTFSDYRSVNGVQLPFRWVQTIGGAADEIFEATSYEINPANIAEKFQQRKGVMLMKKPDAQ